jgi:YhcH/YjgK/YiaL family protein
MIIDKLTNASKYHPLGERIAEGLRFLENTDLTRLTPGRHEIQGNDLFVSVSDYQTKPLEDCKWEAHRKYIDVQLLSEGVEQIGYANIEELTVSEPYNETADLIFLTGKGDLLTLRPGVFAIFYPEDAHMPQIAAEAPHTVRKVVVKIRLMWDVEDA